MALLYSSDWCVKWRSVFSCHGNFYLVSASILSDDSPIAAVFFTAKFIILFQYCLVYKQVFELVSFSKKTGQIFPLLISHRTPLAKSGLTKLWPRMLINVDYIHCWKCDICTEVSRLVLYPILSNSKFFFCVCVLFIHNVNTFFNHFCIGLCGRPTVVTFLVFEPIWKFIMVPGVYFEFVFSFDKEKVLHFSLSECLLVCFEL